MGSHNPPEDQSQQQEKGDLCFFPHPSLTSCHEPCFKGQLGKLDNSISDRSDTRIQAAQEARAGHAHSWAACAHSQAGARKDHVLATVWQGSSRCAEGSWVPNRQGTGRWREERRDDVEGGGDQRMSDRLSATVAETSCRELRHLPAH